MTGAEGGSVRWSADFLSHRPAAALLRYLAVAHYGRGRGDWVEGEYPAHWRPLVEGIVARHRGELDAAWGVAQEGADVATLTSKLEPVMKGAAREMLIELYPGAEGIFGGSTTRSSSRRG
jgi:hypothetical protein